MSSATPPAAPAPLAPDPGHGSLDRGRIPSLDGLRAVAVALVLVAHGCQTAGFPQHHWLQYLGIRCAVGVDVFFVISGFLITTLLLRERERFGRVDIKAFYVRRALRILPAYVGYLTVIALMCVFGVAALERRDWIAALTYTMNFLRHPSWEVGHTWSLSIEEHFYLIWPVAMAVGAASARRSAVFLIVACFALRWGVILFARRYTPMAELWTFTRLDTISFGCLLGLLAWGPAWRARLNDLCARDSVVFAAILLLLTSIFVLSFAARYSVGIAFTFNAFLITLLLWASIRRAASPFGRFLNHPLVAALGVRSYSLYLWQQIFLNPHRDGFINRFPQNILFAIIAAWLSYRLIESPFLALKDRTGAARHGSTELPNTVDTLKPDSARVT